MTHRTLLFASLVLSFAASASSAQEPSIQGDCNAIGNNNIVCSPMRYGFSEQLGQQLLANMPDKKKSVILRTVGGNTDQEVGSQVEQYLVKHGYVVQRTSVGILAPPPDHPFTLQSLGQQYGLTVAPSAH